MRWVDLGSVTHPPACRSDQRAGWTRCCLPGDRACVTATAGRWSLPLGACAEGACAELGGAFAASGRAARGPAKSLTRTPAEGTSGLEPHGRCRASPSAVTVVLALRTRAPAAQEVTMSRALERRPTNYRRDRLVASICGLAVLVGGGLLTSGCTSAQPSTTSATTKTLTPALTYAAPGPHAVGYRVFTTTGAHHHALTLRAWYPTPRPADEQAATITYTAPNKFDQQITPGKDITAVGGALVNAQPEQTAQPYPLVVFSHGYALSPIVYSTLVEHYASQGYIVLAPEHNETFDQSLTGFWKALIDRPDDIRRTIDFAELLNKPGAPLAGLIDMEDVAAVGHSYGGYTALAAAGARFDFAAYRSRCTALSEDDPLNFFCDPVVPKEADMASRAGLPSVPSGLWPSLGDARVKAVISMAGDAYPFGRRGLAELKVPVMALGGTVDDGTPYTWGAKLTYDDAASEDKTLITFPGAGHMIFLDPCKGLPWVQHSTYRDAFCTDAVWGTRPLDVVVHYTTAFLRDTLNGDARARVALAGQQPRLDNVEHDTTIRP